MPGKEKVSVTVGSDVLQAVDRAAKQQGTTRSYMIDRWLRAGALRAAERTLEDATAAYYASLRPEERDDAEELSLAASKAARAATYDAPPRSRRSRAK